LYQEERLAAIVDYLQTYKRMTVQDICDRFAVSRDTARRDIVLLDERGVITRTHGGVLWRPPIPVNSYSERLEIASDSKRRIGQLAASLIIPGDCVILDASTTVQSAALALQIAKGARDVHVITNSIDIVDVLAGKSGLQVRLLGGLFHPVHRYLYGGATLEALALYRADKLLLGTCAILEDGLYFPDEEEGSIIRAMIRRSSYVCVLADHSKFGSVLHHRVADLAEIDAIITDRQPSAHWVELLERHEIELLVAATS